VDQDVESAPRALDGLEDGVEVTFLSDVAREDQRALDGRGKVSHTLFDTLTLVRESELGPLTRQRLSDGPGDAAAIRDTEDQAPAAFEQCHWRQDTGRIMLGR
jgi:hypothetical protein